MVLSRTSPAAAIPQPVACTDRPPTSCADAGCAAKVKVRTMVNHKSKWSPKRCRQLILVLARNRCRCMAGTSFRFRRAIQIGRSAPVIVAPVTLPPMAMLPQFAWMLAGVGSGDFASGVAITSQPVANTSQPIANVSVDYQTWEKRDNAIVDVSIVSGDHKAVRNIIVSCAFYNAADAEIASSTRTLSDYSVGARSKRLFIGVNFGPVKKDAATISCHVVKAEPLEKE